MQQHNPYQNASNAYSNNKAASLSDPRTMEAQALLKAASKLDRIRGLLREGQDPGYQAVGDALEYNKKLWIVFADSMADESHDLPQELRNNVANLSIFMLKRTLEVLANTTAEKLDVMIEINRQIASGLMKTPPKDATDTAAKPPAPPAARGESIDA